MKIVTVISALVAGAAAKHLKRRDEKRAAKPQDDANTYVLEEDEALFVMPREEAEEETGKYIVDAPEPEKEPGDVRKSEKIGAVVLESSRAMDPLTLQSASRVSFDCNDGMKRKFFIPGRNGVFLAKGERGLLTFAGSTFISFDKLNGEFVSPLFHTVPDRRKE